MLVDNLIVESNYALLLQISYQAAKRLTNADLQGFNAYISDADNEVEMVTIWTEEFPELNPEAEESEGALSIPVMIGVLATVVGFLVLGYFINRRLKKGPSKKRAMSYIPFSNATYDDQL